MDVLHCNCVLLDKLAVGRTIDYLSKILVVPAIMLFLIIQ